MIIKKNFWLRMIPVSFIVFVTICMSLVVYDKMMAAERESCWERLENATRSTAAKIETRIVDNLNFLEAVSDSYILTQGIDKEAEVAKYLTRVMEMTIFEKIDVILPDGGILLQSGEIVNLEGELSFEELVERGMHVSPRCTDPFIGKEVIYCFTPVDVGNDVIAMLCGTLDCETLGEIFDVFTYSGESQLFVIDCSDGQYIIDNWHDELGNIYELGNRTGLDGEEVDMLSPIINLEEKRSAYVSRTNGEHSYQFCTPIKDFCWSVCVVLQEEVIFAHAQNLQNILISIGIVEIILLLVYLAWNIWMSTTVARSEEHAKRLEYDKATNEAKAKFISNMSHDIRTPLNGIVGMLHIIKGHRDDSKTVDDCLKKIEISTQYLSTLVNDMLDINEIEKNDMMLEAVPIDLRNMADDLAMIVELKAKDAKVDFHVDYSYLKHPYVVGSQIHIERILVNLIGNAIKYSKENDGEVSLIIDEIDCNQEQGTYRFIIQDNGIGMTKEFQENMYSAFAQEKVSARSSYEGYGLGLTIVYQLIKKMGGTIELESEKGKGSRFTVVLPLKIGKESDFKKQSVSNAVDLSGMHVLLVEDNEINLEIAQVLLEDEGITVTTALNGKKATELFASSEINTFDMILMDIMMPEMDGCEATEQIRGMDRVDAKTVPIVAMTASAFEEEIKRCKKVGMNAHIAKPLDVDKLMLQIAQYRKMEG